jgi:hypothetical protein
MAFDPTDLTQYPAFTTKQEMLKELYAELEAHGVPIDILYRLNNTALAGLADAATVFDDADMFGA